MANIVQLQPDQTSTREAPKRIVRPCDNGLYLAVKAMETQVGTVEAYNKLCDAAAVLKARIDAGEAKPAHPMYATDPAWIYPAGEI